MATTNQTPARLYFILARAAPTAIIFRRSALFDWAIGDRAGRQLSDFNSHTFEALTAPGRAARW